MTQSIIKEYDFSMEQEVLNEYAAGIWADYVTYCNKHEIDINDLNEPMAAKTQIVYELKRKIIETGECQSMEDLKPVKAQLKELKEYLRELKEKE